MVHDLSFLVGDALGGGLYTMINTLPMLFSVAAYVLSSLGFYTLASRRGIRNAWMAWVPVVNIWILGSLSDQYQYCVKGQVKSRRKLLLILKIISAIMGVVIFFVIFFSIFSIVFESISYMDEDQIMGKVFEGLFSVIGVALLLLPLSIVTAVFRYMALYDVYRSTDPQNATLFLVLSILISMTEPFFVFFNREKDLGMPPRKPAPFAGDPGYAAPQNAPAAAAPQSAPAAPAAEAPQSEPAPESAQKPSAEPMAEPEAVQQEAQESEPSDSRPQTPEYL